jgi:hypothetical protein
MANTKGDIVDRMDKKAIGSAVDLMRMAAHYLEVMAENDGLLKAKNALIAEKRSLIERNKRLHLELETVSKDRCLLQQRVSFAESKQVMPADDPDFEVADAPADEKEVGPLGRSVEEFKRFVSDG